MQCGPQVSNKGVQPHPTHTLWCDALQTVGKSLCCLWSTPQSFKPLPSLPLNIFTSLPLTYYQLNRLAFSDIFALCQLYWDLQQASNLICLSLNMCYFCSVVNCSESCLMWLKVFKFSNWKTFCGCNSLVSSGLKKDSDYESSATGISQLCCRSWTNSDVTWFLQ